MRYPEKIAFTKDYKIATNIPERLVIREGEDKAVEVDPEKVRKEYIVF